jgi:hypothetical protein
MSSGYSWKTFPGMFYAAIYVDLGGKIVLVAMWKAMGETVSIAPTRDIVEVKPSRTCIWHWTF